MRSLLVAFPDGKPDSTFPGNAHFAGRIPGRKTGTPLFLEMLYKPPRSFDVLLRLVKI
jgi:hypothetical protein